MSSSVPPRSAIAASLEKQRTPITVKMPSARAAAFSIVSSTISLTVVVATNFLPQQKISFAPAMTATETANRIRSAIVLLR